MQHTHSNVSSILTSTGKSRKTSKRSKSSKALKASVSSSFTRKSLKTLKHSKSTRALKSSGSFSGRKTAQKGYRVESILASEGPIASINLNEVESVFFTAREAEQIRRIKVDEVAQWKTVQDTIVSIKGSIFRMRITGIIIVALLLLLLIPIFMPERHSIAVEMLQILLALFSGIVLERNF